jgi:hypothetical protein
LPGTTQRCHDGTVGLDDVPRELLVAIAAVFATFALVAAIRSWLRGVRRRRRFARAAAGEREAIGLLEAHGFVIEGAQVAGSYELAVDGAPLTAAVRADYVVRAGSLRYVAEVKTGRVAPSLATATTRRQLLEYQHAFGVAGVLLVDADARTVQRVDFGRRASRPIGLVVVLAALVAGAVGAWFFHAPPDSGCRDARSFRKKAP